MLIWSICSSVMATLVRYLFGLSRAVTFSSYFQSRFRLPLHSVAIATRGAPTVPDQGVMVSQGRERVP